MRGRVQRRALPVALVAAGLLAIPFGSAGSVAGASHVLTYAQAKAAGYDVPLTPAELGQKACPPLSGHVLPGFDSRAAMNAAIAATPRSRTCAADPTGDRFLVDGAPLSSQGGPTGQYRWVGAQVPSPGNYIGGEIRVEVSDSDLNAKGKKEEHLNGYVNASSTSTRCVISGQQYNAWVQTGWKQSTGDKAPVIYYETCTSNGGHSLGTKYELQNGKYYGFRVAKCSNGTCAYYFDCKTGDNDPKTCKSNEGTWVSTKSNSGVVCGSKCALGEYFEGYQADGKWPKMTSKDGVGFTAKLKTTSGSWTNWTKGINLKDGGSPYKPYVGCFSGKYNNWRADFDSC